LEAKKNELKCECHFGFHFMILAVILLWQSPINACKSASLPLYNFLSLTWTIFLPSRRVTNNLLT
jgi:hypothetical protein